MGAGYRNKLFGQAILRSNKESRQGREISYSLEGQPAPRGLVVYSRRYHVDKLLFWTESVSRLRGVDKSIHYQHNHGVSLAPQGNRSATGGT